MALLETIASERACPCQRLRDQFPVSKATISHHIKELVRAGLVDARREGQYLNCEVRRDVLDAYTAELRRGWGRGSPRQRTRGGREASGPRATNMLDGCKTIVTGTPDGTEYRGGARVSVARAAQFGLARRSGSSAATPSRRHPRPRPPSASPPSWSGTSPSGTSSAAASKRWTTWRSGPGVGLHPAPDIHRGAEVRKGEVLFEIDPRPYQADLDRAQAQLEQARTAAELAQREVGPRREAGERAGHFARGIRQPDQRPGQRRRGRTGRGGRGRDRRLNLGWTWVRSPIAGRVSRAR